LALIGALEPAQHLRVEAAVGICDEGHDLRRLQLAEGSTNAATLHGLDDAETRASALAARYADGRGRPPTPRQ
jgi:hypothetical protein